VTDLKIKPGGWITDWICCMPRR